MNKLVPQKMFFTKGVGYHQNRLQSFELALRNAGIEKFNLVPVSSIFPPGCIQISKEKGIKELQPGELTFVVMARECTNEPNRLISSAVGLACPKDKEQYGYISEHHAFGETKIQSADLAEDIAASMLASTLGIELDPEVAWDERKQVYKVDRNQFVSQSIAYSVKGHKEGLWTTVVACAVFILKT